MRFEIAIFLKTQFPNSLFSLQNLNPNRTLIMNSNHKIFFFLKSMTVWLLIIARSAFQMKTRKSYHVLRWMDYIREGH
jgi:hypothetical protein